ncbi:MAG: YihY/virulence factor BrkB family protein [Candidatus Saccharimonadales bacterium]
MQRFLNKLDEWQRRRPIASFIFAVIKKSGDDQLGYQAALITYYGFLALFPLLLIATTVLQIVLRSDRHLEAQVLNSINQYLPLIGGDLKSNIQGFHRSGLALIVGALLTFYGARGVAVALQNALNHLWGVPRFKRPGFPKNVLKSFGLIIFGGGGFILASVLSSAAASLGRSFVFTGASILISLIILFGTFLFIFRFGTVSAAARRSHNFIGALGAAIGLQVLQTGGGFLLAHEIKHLGVLYGTFAVVLGLLFWLYLQVQVVLYSVEIATVHNLKLVPRSLTGNRPTDGDERVQKLATARGQLQKSRK